MTNEEAIGHIKDVICENNTIKPNIVVFEQEKEALYMAIKALEQQPCEDAISRQAVKEQMIKYGFHAPDMTVKEFVEDLPSVSTENPNRCSDAISKRGEKNISKGFEDFMIKSLRKQAESEDGE